MKALILTASAVVVATAGYFGHDYIDKNREYRATNDFGGVACISRRSHRDFALAKLAGSQDRMLSMLAEYQCFIIAHGSVVRVQERDGKVARAYLSRLGGNRPVLAWTFSENFK